MASKVSSLFSPSISTTALLCPEPRSSERAALAVMRSLMRGSPPVPPLACSRSISPTRVSESRLRTLSAPTNDETNSESGLEDVLGGVVLGEDAALLEDGDLVPHLYGLVYVVGDEDDGLLYIFLNPQELVLKPF